MNEFFNEWKLQSPEIQHLLDLNRSGDSSNLPFCLINTIHEIEERSCLCLFQIIKMYFINAAILLSKLVLQASSTGVGLDVGNMHDGWWYGVRKDRHSGCACY
jgi:hypothetical protein